MQTVWKCASGGRALIALLPVLYTACASSGAVVVPPAAPPAVPGAAVTEAPRLPQIPPANGELRIDVVYPPEGATIATADSTFIFGNVGRGGGTLTINGVPVELAPNGAWLAFLPVPTNGIYQLSATSGGQTVTAT